MGVVVVQPCILVSGLGGRDRVPALCWLPGLHGGPYGVGFVAGSGSCVAAGLSGLLASCLAAVEGHVIKYCEGVCGRSNGCLFWSIGNSGEVLGGLEPGGFIATSLSACGFSALCATLPRGLVKDRLIDLVGEAFRGRGGVLSLPCVWWRGAFFASEGPGECHAWSYWGVCDALAFLLDSVFVRFGAGLCRQVVWILVGTSCAPLVADLFLFCCGRGFVVSLFGGWRAGVVGAFGTASGCLDDVLDIYDVCFDSVVGRVCPSGLRLGGANASGAVAAFLDLHLSVSDGVVSARIYDKRGGFGFGVVGFPFLDGGVPLSAFCGVCVSRLVRFAGASGCVAPFGTRSGLLTQRLLGQGCRCCRLRGAFSGFYGRCCGLVSGFQVGLGSLLRQGLPGPDFYGDSVCRLRRIVGSGGFLARFIGVVSHYGRVGCNINVLQQTACLVSAQSRLATLLSSLIARRWVGLQTL